MLRQEVSHCQGRLLGGREAFSDVLVCKTKQAGGGDQGVEEGDFICLLDLHKVQPHVALKHHQTGHGPANCLSRGVQSQVGRTVKLFEGCRVWARLVHGAE